MMIRDDSFENYFNEQFSDIEIPFMKGRWSPSEILRQVDEKAYKEHLYSFWDDQRNDSLGKESLPDAVYKRNADRFTAICVISSNKRLIPFVGAGVSASCGFPTWRGFLEIISKECRVRPNTLDKWFDTYEYEDVATKLVGKMKFPGFNESYERCFTSRSLPDPMSLPSVIRDLFSGPTITTNFDKLLEKVTTAAFVDVFHGNSPGNFLRMAREGSNVLLKLHGDLNQPGSRVLTKKEYNSAYGNGNIRMNKPLPTVLGSLYSGSVLLFIGCSLVEDRTLDVFRNVFKDIGNDHSIRHYAILESPPSDARRAVREKELNSIGIFPIWYSNSLHQTVKKMLRSVGLVQRGELDAVL